MHRGEILQLRGAWDEALEELERALARLAPPASPRILGAAAYVQAEIHRLRGEFPPAEDAYRQAAEHGREPQPGLALLRLAQGRTDAAAAAIRRAEQETDDPLTRARLLGPYVEIVLACGDIDAARTAADALAAIAAEMRQPYLDAVAAHATGMTLLSGGDARGALSSLRRAWREWHRLEAPHEAARSRVQDALACRALGDADSADMELDAAMAAFEALGATPDAATVAAAPGADQRPGGLTARELEVLALVARGNTNRQIADEPGDQREDGGQPRRPHLHQAGRDVPLGRHRLRLRARPDLTPAMAASAHQHHVRREGRGAGAVVSRSVRT